MLHVTIPANEKPIELWDEVNEEFINIPAGKEVDLRLEHSLVSLSKWEEKWCKSFFSVEEKTDEEIIDYIRCMTLNKNLEPERYYLLSDKDINKIKDYILAPMTATTFADDKKEGHKRIITSELIYCWMIAMHIPVEFEKWHLNRLITLIRVCEAESRPTNTKKKSQQELADEYARINKIRREKLNSKG